MAEQEETARSPEDVVRALLDGVCRASVGDASALDEVAALYAEPTYVLHPLRPELPAVRTREDFDRHFGALRDRSRTVPSSREAVGVLVHHTTDPEVVVTEFRYRSVVEGRTLETPCIWVTRVRDGRIVEARDYNGQGSPVVR